MDSLLASYASSDEEDEGTRQQNPRSSPSRPREQIEDDWVPKSGGFLSFLPPPKSSASLSFSLPPPKVQTPISSTYLPKNPQKSDLERQLKSSLEDSELPSSPPKPSSSLFSSIPQPKSKSFSSIPQPKSKSSSTSFFSVLPPSKTEPQVSSASSAPAPRKVVQFRPPTINPPANLDSDDEDDDEDEKEKQKKKSESFIQTSSVKSFLSSIPKPKNSTTLGALPSDSGTGRRSMLEVDVPSSDDSNTANAGTAGVAGLNGGNYEGHSADNQVSVSSVSVAGGSSEYAPNSDYSSWGSGSENYVSYDGYTGYENNSVTGEDYSNWAGETVNYANYGSEYGTYSSYGQYEGTWADGSTASPVPQISGSADNVMRVPGKRGRNDVPPEIVEVKQDELMKNRPREDQVKLTGIAFGPSYQPASTKGKPSKLHKRKHQIGSLYFDMKQKEMELAERRARGFLTKAQTQGKYGW